MRIAEGNLLSVPVITDGGLDWGSTFYLLSKLHRKECDKNPVVLQSVMNERLFLFKKKKSFNKTRSSWFYSKEKTDEGFNS